MQARGDYRPDSLSRYAVVLCIVGACAKTSSLATVNIVVETAGGMRILIVQKSRATEVALDECDTSKRLGLGPILGWHSTGG
jgi:hypothetical protein